MQRSKLIIVANRLPVTAVKTDDGWGLKRSTGGLVTGLLAVHRLYRGVWIGWPGTVVGHREGDVGRLEAMLLSEGLRPVFIDERDLKDYYYGFCNETIWPLFHHFPEYAVFRERFWSAYRRVNRAFAERVLEVARKDDLIWVHDYHLMLLPELLRKELGDEATIGFFLHIPFPPYELFRMLPWRREILEGLLSADLVGFHTYDYVKHFFSCVRLILGYEHAFGRLIAKGRVVRVDAFPMSIDYDGLVRAARSREVEAEVDRLRRELRDRRVVLSIDRLDYTKGVLEKLRAFDKFLERFPRFQGKVVLVLAVSPSRTAVRRYASLKRAIDELVGKINGRWGRVDWQPVVYIHRFLPDKTLLALYRVADVALVTPLRDGMNLVCKEYVASKIDENGVLILSETAGASSELVEAIVVNPCNVSEVARALSKALTMPTEERVRRLGAMQSRLKRHTVFRWARDFLEKLLQVKEVQKELAAARLTPRTLRALIREFAESRSKLLLLDYDGTLVGFAERPEEARPDEELLNLLMSLAEIPGCKVVIVSGRDKETMESWFGRVGVDLVAEHGAWLKEEGTWKIVGPLRGDWKDEVRPLLELYVDKTPGSFIEEKEFSIAWHYRRADRELGAARAKELKEALLDLTANLGLSVLEGDKVIEVRISGVDKGRAALRWLSKRGWDFVLAAGDDRTDEDMFAVLPERAYSIKVGFAPSRARFNVASPAELRSILRDFVSASESRT